MIERYEDEDIHAQWNPAMIYRRWFEVEVTHMLAVAGAEVAEALALVRVPTPVQVRYHERETGHDVAAFLVALDHNIQQVIGRLNPELDDVATWNRVRSSLHYGLTSSDVADTAQSLGILRSRLAVRKQVTALTNALTSFIDAFAPWATTLGRTHGQLATPMPAEHRWSVLAEMLDRAWTRADAGFAWMDVGKMSGPVGVGDPGDGKALAELDLRETTSTQIVPRDRMAHWAHNLAELTTVCEAIATQVWLLAQAGVNEIRITAPGSVGSSAMPHKVNPIVAENIRGLARVARAHAELLQTGVVQWGEHDLAHSSIERIAVPDLLHLTCTILSRTATLVSGLSWTDPGRPADYVDTSEELRQLQAQGVAYVDAHRQLTDLYRAGKITATTTNTEETH